MKNTLEKFLGIEAWTIRFTTKHTFDEIESFIDKYVTHKYIISMETRPKQHYHCYVESQLVKSEIGALVNKHLGLKGNQQYSCIRVGNKRQMKKYTLKDGYFRYQNYEYEEINVLRKCSTKKLRNSDFTEKLGLLEEKYMGTHQSWDSFIDHYLLLRSEYCTLRKCDVEGYLNQMKVKKEGMDGAKYLRKLWFN